MIPCTLIHGAYDDATIFSSRCAIEIKKILSSAGFQISELRDADACEEKLHKHLKDCLSEVRGFLNYGHGNERTLFGHNGQILLDPDSAGLLSNKICYIFSCLAAKELGGYVIKKGAICLMGFNGEFTYSTMHEDIFRICANSGIKAMIEKKATAKEAFEIMKETFNQMLTRVLNSRKDYADWLVLIFLVEDRDYLELLGKDSASLWQA